MIKEYFRLFARFVFPGGCLLCGSSDGTPVCGICDAKLEYITAPFCVKCGQSLPYGGENCYECRKEKRQIDIVRAAFSYEGDVRKLIIEMKYKKKEHLAEYLSGKMMEFMKRENLVFPVDIVMPIPLHSSNLRERGFNQSMSIARGVGRCINREAKDGVLVRKKKTRPQYGLAKEERLRNIEGAFMVRDFSCVNKRDILLVDDVATTLSTLEEAAGVLKEAGARRVYGLVVARD